MIVENINSFEHAWLFITSSDNWQRVVERGSFGVKSYHLLKEAKPGEPCVAYIRRQKLFAGLGELTEGYYCDKMEEYPHRVRLEVKLNLANGVPLHSINNALQFIRDKTNPGAYLRGEGVKKIPISDYRVIKEAQPSIQEVPEKATEIVDREPLSIDSHTKAEGVLLELGNCLEEYETYITPDDKNKEFRNKPLAEIARLQEIPNSIAPGIMGTVRHIDVIWFKDNHPSHCFEVEHSTNITQALVRFSELQGLHTRFTIVAPAEARDKFDREVERMLFRSIKDRVRFKSYDELAKFLAVAQEFAKEKQNFFGQ